MAKIESYSVEYEEGSQPLMTVLIRLDDRDPRDVVIEKIAASLPKGYQRSFAEGGLVPPRKGRSHPFEGPEMFDDEPHGEVPAHYVPDNGTLDAKILAEAIAIDPAKISAGVIRAMEISSGTIDPSKISAGTIQGVDKDYPRLKELFEAKRAEAAQIVAEGEGDWLLGGDDKVGDDE